MKCFSTSPVVLPTTFLSQVMIYILLNVSLKHTEGQPSGPPHITQFPHIEEKRPANVG